MELLPRSFYLPSALEVAPALLGHLLLRRRGGEWIGGEIVETEAYLVGDPACHAYRRETPRNRAMWGQEGRSYVYRIYGSYLCFNAVCRPEGVAEAVLIRAVEPSVGIEQQRELRPVASDKELTSGPSKLCIALDIGPALNFADLCDPKSELVIARNPERDAWLERNAPLVRTTRIGLTRGADFPLRWYLDGSKWVSKRTAPFEGNWKLPA